MFPPSQGGFLCFLKRRHQILGFSAKAQWVSTRKSYYSCDTSHVTFADARIRGSKSPELVLTPGVQAASNRKVGKLEETSQAQDSGGIGNDSQKSSRRSLKKRYTKRLLLQHGGGKAGVREDQRHLPPLKSPDSTVNRRHHLLRPSHRTTISVFLEFEAAGGQADVLAFALTTKWPARHLQKIRPNRVSRSGCPYSKPAFSKVPPEPPSKLGEHFKGSLRGK